MSAASFWYKGSIAQLKAFHLQKQHWKSILNEPYYKAGELDFLIS